MRPFTLVLVFCLCLLWMTPQAGDDDQSHKPLRERVKISKYLAEAYSFSAEPLPDQPATQMAKGYIPLRQSSLTRPDDTIGYTMFDMQQYCSMGRQIEHRGTGNIHFVWTAKDNDIPGVDRGIAYQAYNLSTETFYFPAGAIRADGGYAGFAALDADATCAILAGNEYRIDLTNTVPATYWDGDGSVVNGAFQQNWPIDYLGFYNPTDPRPFLWPKIEWDTYVDSSIVHMVVSEATDSVGAARTIAYYRRSGPYGATGTVVWVGPRLIDTVTNISVTVASSPTDDKVALIWSPPVDYKRDTPNEFDNQYENDVWYALSDSAGFEWITSTPSYSIGQLVDSGLLAGENITTYAACDNYKAYCDLSALFSEVDNNLHIVWNCRRWDCDSEVYRRRSAIFHWSPNTDTITTVVRAEWDTGGSCYGYSLGGDASKMTIAECDAKLYILYTQFGSTCYPCYDCSDPDSVMNGELFLTASSDGGISWDAATNLSNTETPGCGDGDCSSEYWASLARYGRVANSGQYAGQPVLDILFVEDKAPGACITPESGKWVSNPVRWLTTSCRDVGDVQESFYFVHITDTHIGSWFHWGSGERLQKAVDRIIGFSPPPAFVVVSGDLVAYGGGNDSDYGQFEGIMEDLETNGIDYYVCPGNHDTRYGDGIDNYKSHFGDALDYYVDTLGIRLISLFSGYDASTIDFIPLFCVFGFCYGYYVPDLLPEASGISGDQYNLLSGWLTDPEAPDKKIVFLHHPVVFCTWKWVGFRVDWNGFALMPFERNCANACIMNRRDQVWDLLRDPDDDGEYNDGVRVVLSGHTHKNDYMYRSDSYSETHNISTANWYHTECDTVTGLNPLHANTGALCEDLAYRIVAVEKNDVKVSRTYFFDKTATSSAYWIGTDEGSKNSLAAQPDTIWPAGRIHIRTYDSTAHIGFNAGTKSIDFEIDDGYYGCSFDSVEGGYQASSEVVSVVLSDTLFAGSPVYIIEYEADDFENSVVVINSGYTKGNGCRNDYTHAGIPAPAGSRGWILVYNDRADTMLYWDENGDYEVDAAYPPGDYFVYADCGDANGDGDVNVGDAVYLISYIFKGGPPPISECVADANGDGNVNVGDAVYLVNYVFKGGPSPVEDCCH